MSDRIEPAPVSAEPPSKGPEKFIDVSQRTIVEWNITRFRSLLLTESDPDRHALLSKLLAEEQAKLVTQLLANFSRTRRS
jgi:hypothetical protein